VANEGLGGLKNGELCKALEGKWDVLLTTDKRFPRGHDLAVVIIRAWSNGIDDLLPWVSEVLRVLPLTKKGEIMEVVHPDLLGH